MPRRSYLHSTMYLLNHILSKARSNRDNTFTFHYVSIKSLVIVIIELENFRFTFHYVSIKSSSALLLLLCRTYLHSTMYLLNPGEFHYVVTDEKFTFHYVSIKS